MASINAGGTLNQQRIQYMIGYACSWFHCANDYFAHVHGPLAFRHALKEKHGTLIFEM